MITRLVAGTRPDGEGFVRGVRAVVGDFFADHEQQRDRQAGVAQPLGGADHRRGDALGVAGAAAEDASVVAARRNERRDGVEMRRERDDAARRVPSRTGRRVRR